MDEDCGICLEELVRPTKIIAVLTNCGHRFHRDCIREMFRQTGTNQQPCPNCRVPFPEANIRKFTDDEAEKAYDDTREIYRRVAGEGASREEENFLKAWIMKFIGLFRFRQGCNGSWLTLQNLLRVASIAVIIAAAGFVLWYFGPIFVAWISGTAFGSQLAIIFTWLRGVLGMFTKTIWDFVKPILPVAIMKAVYEAIKRFFKQ